MTTETDVEVTKLQSPFYDRDNSVASDQIMTPGPYSPQITSQSMPWFVSPPGSQFEEPQHQQFMVRQGTAVLGGDFTPRMTADNPDGDIVTAEQGALVGTRMAGAPGGHDPDEFTLSILRPQLWQTPRDRAQPMHSVGVMNNPHTGETYELLEDEIPGPTRDISRVEMEEGREERQLKYEMMNGGLDPVNDYRPHKDELLEPEPMMFSGRAEKEDFGRYVVPALRQTMYERVAEQLYANRNGIYPAGTGPAAAMKEMPLTADDVKIMPYAAFTNRGTYVNLEQTGGVYAPLEVGAMGRMANSAVPDFRERAYPDRGDYTVSGIAGGLGLQALPYTDSEKVGPGNYPEAPVPWALAGPLTGVAPERGMADSVPLNMRTTGDRSAYQSFVETPQYGSIDARQTITGNTLTWQQIIASSSLPTESRKDIVANQSNPFASLQAQQTIGQQPLFPETEDHRAPVRIAYEDSVPLMPTNMNMPPTQVSNAMTQLGPYGADTRSLRETEQSYFYTPSISRVLNGDAFGVSTQWQPTIDHKGDYRDTMTTPYNYWTSQPSVYAY